MVVKTNVVAIMQDRVGSTHLSGKVMMDLAGEPMLVRVINRISRAKNIDQIVIATTDQPDDETIIQLCDKRGRAIFRGSENDVLDRYYQTAVHFRADVVVRITSDCHSCSQQSNRGLITNGEICSRSIQ